LTVRHKFGDVELTEIAVRGLMERKAIENSRKATLPVKPEDAHAQRQGSGAAVGAAAHARHRPG